MQTQTLAKLACAYSGVVWGVFWLPLRAMDEAGITGAWATVVFYLAPLAMVAPLIVWRWRSIARGGVYLQLVGFAAAFSLVTYADALVYTEVIRAMLLYYLTPLWSTLLARAVLGERITAARSIAMGLGFLGALVIFRFDVGMPLPQNAGDWLGLAAGIGWAVTAVLMNRDTNSSGVDYMLMQFAWGSVIAIALAFMPFAGAVTDVDWAVMLDIFWSVTHWLIPVLAIIVIPGVFAAMWGTPQLSPGLVGLLFMTEISVGTVTAALWAGEPFGWREITGIVLISAAGIAEGVYEWITRRPSASAGRPA
jgi:drug/metabolite transporter (DMT)-like permease